MAIPRQRVLLSPASWPMVLGELLTGGLIEGDQVGVLEERFAQYIGSRHAIAIPSGRAGLKYALESFDLEPGAEIICPAFTYPIVPFVIEALGFRPRFVDIRLPELGLDPELLAQAITPQTRGIIPTHLFGVPCDIEPIMAIARDKGLRVIEDCAHCCGAKVGDTLAGAFGDVGYFSFETSKCINALGGGMLTTSDDQLAEKLRHARDQGSLPKTSKILKRLAKSTFEALVTLPPLFSLGVYPALRLLSMVKKSEDVLGSAYVGSDINMKGRSDQFTNYQARLALPQLEGITALNAERTRTAQSLSQALSGALPIHAPVAPHHTPNWLLFSALVPNLGEMSHKLLAQGIDTKRHYMRDCTAIFTTDDHCPTSQRADRELIHLPSYPGLSEDNLQRIAATLKGILQEGSPQ
ncbi:MAG: DegT/DnrJ/EryC1/StrS family aminotransferase [Magnetococcales bacterium]|nr:DegT/DnrJ/EryC1/StrS family aminotransferase [Magnetococcales bacterium]